MKDNIILKEMVKLLEVNFFANDKLQNENKILKSFNAWAKIYPIKPYYKNHQNIIESFNLNYSSQIYKIILRSFVKKKNEIQMNLKNENEINNCPDNDFLSNKPNNINKRSFDGENKKVETSNSLTKENYDEKNHSYEIENYCNFNFLIWNEERFKILHNFVFRNEKMDTLETLITKIADGENYD